MVIIADLSIVNGSWNWGMLHSLFPQEILNKILLIPSPRPGNYVDRFTWGGTENDKFTILDTFNRLSEYNSTDNIKHWSRT